MTTLLIGASGALLLLVGFALQKFGTIDGKSQTYNLLNFLGAGLLTWYSVLLGSWPFIVLEGIWTLVAGWYLVRHVLRVKQLPTL